jgi:tetratricopeptide (TPR) repeat protein
MGLPSTVFGRAAWVLVLRRLLGRAGRPADSADNGQGARHGARLSAAEVEQAAWGLRAASARTWMALELALAGEAVWEEATHGLPAAAAEVVRRQLRAIHALLAAAVPGGDAEAAARCRREVQAVREELTRGDDALRGEEVVAPAADGPPGPLAEGDADEQEVARLAGELEQNGWRGLAALVGVRTGGQGNLVLRLLEVFFSRALPQEADGEGTLGRALRGAGGPPEGPFAALAAFIEREEDRLQELLLLPGDAPAESAAAAPAEPARQQGAWDERAAQERFQQGLGHFHNAEYDRAVPLFTAALRADPTMSAALFYRGEAHRLLCDYDRALADYTAALRLDPNSAAIYLSRGQVHRLTGALDRAVADCTTALRLDPESSAGYANRASAYADLGVIEQAIADYTAALQLQPNDLWACLSRGKAHVQKADYASAIADFTHILSLNPNYVLAYLNRGDAYRRKGDYASAILDYDEALRHHPQNAVARSNRGLAHELKGDREAAVADYSEALRIDPAGATTYCRRGVIYRLLGRYDPALEDLNEAARRDPKNPTPFYNRGTIHLARGDLAEAVGQFTQALALSPQLTVAYLNRALAHDRAGRFQSAIRDCSQALQIDPELAAAYLVRGAAWTHAGKLPQAVADLTRAVELDPHFAPAYYERAIAHTLRGDYKAALTDYSRLIELDPGNALAHANRGIIYQLKGAHERAMADFGRALRLDPKFILTAWHRGLARLGKDRSTALLADYTEGRRPHPTPPAPAARPAPAEEPGREAAEADEEPAAGEEPTLLVAETDEHPAPAAAPERRRRGQRTLTHTPAARTGVHRARGQAASDTGVAEQAATAAAPAVPPEDDVVEILLEEEEEESRDIPELIVKLPGGDGSDPEIIVQPPTSQPTFLGIPLRCPICRREGPPLENLPGGRVRCSFCQAAFLPSASVPTPGAPATPARPVAPKRTPPRRRGTGGPRFHFNLSPRVVVALAASLLVVMVLGLVWKSYADRGFEIPQTKMTAAELWQEFARNNTAANRKYVESRVTVTGEVEDAVTAEPKFGHRVRLRAAENGKGFISCGFVVPGDMQDVHPGQTITVSGEVMLHGRRGSEVTLTACKVLAR